ncbi:NAD(P)-dependent alcohol dehydrogenase [Actinophytocola oryzae]|uniref:NADPH:quinone reductase-like Zn-dependent oxidoreductase n=1 Tax=Actinophytocola oryzae TaxID=502181 RepID=A0A4R7VY72_9PSEU|nr:NAD(P)-dependent alcohol dehydrogenase [Actinophytocola oryzae]TDV55014.1 NADPH:quinone reductase-like Zn-dependent oxidoreductase [Actinophytocola oryzae]
MKAAVHAKYGPPDVVSIAEVDTPSVGDDDILVAVHATTVNRTDCAYRAAKPFFVRTATGLTRPKRAILGTEYAGVVSAAGANVTDFAVGDRVFGYNEGPFGTHAEFVAVAAGGPVAAIPDGVSFESAAAATEGAHYALAFIRVSGVGAGHDVLVHGATGGIGSAAVQLLKQLGATVTAVCDTANLTVVQGLGPDRVVDYTATDFTADVLKYDAVFDAVGKSTFGRCKRLLKPGGVYLSSELGPLAQNLVLPLTTSFRKAKVRFPFPKQDQRMVVRIGELLGSGDFRPLIDRRYRLDEIVEAYEYVETGRKVGNVVVDVVPG